MNLNCGAEHVSDKGYRAFCMARISVVLGDPRICCGLDKDVTKIRLCLSGAANCEVCLRYFTKSLRATVFMQTVYSTVIQGNSDWVCDKGVNLTNIRKSVTYSV